MEMCEADGFTPSRRLADACSRSGLKAISHRLANPRARARHRRLLQERHHARPSLEITSRSSTWPLLLDQVLSQRSSRCGKDYQARLASLIAISAAALAQHRHPPSVEDLQRSHREADGLVRVVEVDGEFEAPCRPCFPAGVQSQSPVRRMQRRAEKRADVA